MMRQNRLAAGLIAHVLALSGCSSPTATANSIPSSLPQGFVYLKDIDPTIQESMRYCTNHNFMGQPVPGYAAPRIACTRQAAERLKAVQADVNKQGYNLVVYDAYRPQRAVNAFVTWSRDESDQRTKAHYYPTLPKGDLFKLGYLYEKSTHSRGSTFDLTLIPIGQKISPLTISTRTLKNGEVIPILNDNTLDMGSSFDLFHEVSHHGSPLIDQIYHDRREFLRTAMTKHGFKDIACEWWHYTLRDEPYPDTYFDFVF